MVRMVQFEDKLSPFVKVIFTCGPVDWHSIIYHAFKYLLNVKTPSVKVEGNNMFRVSN